ncbi:ribosomal-protein-alanine acetyltransferase [Microbacterium endophyticum]|uniref:Ribosomal-protein-alanine acetyltransferase n=1 Tax=Microbacterium endophyticum TaxID=1526412 RepID=A0A7W4YLX1_9MICO|nr:ribosomal protein S18-alanine N-acetyltransferase [Microbacterium endophyticum]MBB2975608.1 ribosomal-protein-alanine acetyltransferase [Microbacterium endophyticum]NIK35373.1 ribosomal-protein-alanine acetyltransferase [Microbacterium endophyticum]
MTRMRRATVADLDAIMALEEASFPTDAWSSPMMREELSSPHSFYLVLEEEVHTGLAGYAGLRALSGSHDADVQTITVAAASRGKGLGRTLLRALLDEATQRGIRDVFLEVRADNPVAQALYVSEGFVDIGRRPGYYQPDDVDAIVMKCEMSHWHRSVLRVDAEPGTIVT